MEWGHSNDDVLVVLEIGLIVCFAVETALLNSRPTNHKSFEVAEGEGQGHGGEVVSRRGFLLWQYCAVRLCTLRWIVRAATVHTDCRRIQVIGVHFAAWQILQKYLIVLCIILKVTLNFGIRKTEVRTRKRNNFIISITPFFKQFCHWWSYCHSFSLK